MVFTRSTRGSRPAASSANTAEGDQRTTVSHAATCLGVADVAIWLRRRQSTPRPTGRCRSLTCVLRGAKGNPNPDLFHAMRTTDRPPRPAASCGGHPRPMLSDRRSAQKPREQDVFRPSGGGESVDVAPRPVASARLTVATLLATSAEPSALPRQQRVTRGPTRGRTADPAHACGQ